VLEARNLKHSTQKDTTLDPYVIVSFKKGILKMMSPDKEGRFQSRILENTTNPMWNEEFILHPSKPETDVIVVKAYDRDRIGKKDTLLGKARLPVINFWNKGLVDQWVPLETTFSKTGHGEIHLLINYNESGQMGMGSMGQGMSSTMPTSNQTGMMQPQNNMMGSTGTTMETTSSNIPGSQVNTGSGFSKDPIATQTGYVQTSNAYPPPVGTHGATNL